MQDGKKIYRYRDALSMPRGIEMKEYGGSDGTLLFVGQYFGDGTCNPRPKRVYRVEVEYLADSAEWYALVRDDAHSIVRLRGKTKWQVAHAALGALRGFLAYMCQNTNGNRKRRRRAVAAESGAGDGALGESALPESALPGDGAGGPKVGTESAEEALAATVARQKGEE